MGFSTRYQDIVEIIRTKKNEKTKFIYKLLIFGIPRYLVRDETKAWYRYIP